MTLLNTPVRRRTPQRARLRTGWVLAVLLGGAVWAMCGPACAQPGPAASLPRDPVARGQAIVQRDCAACHAVGPSGESPNPQAPRFARLHERYDVNALGEALAEGLTVGHGPMPEWSFDPRDTAAILAYLKSLETPTRPRAPHQE